MSQSTIESVLQEKRLFSPSPDFSQSAHIKSLEDYKKLYEQAKADPEKFWAQLAEQELHLDMSDEALSLISEAGFDPIFGARPLKRAIQKLLEDQYALGLGC